jgi:lipopolysaccharide export LptBFGC system permease protein LptF
MRLLARYLAREIYASVALVFLALLMLFSFFDLIHELSSMGSGNYRLGYVLLFVLLTLPGHVYELFPVAVLIGAIVALVQMAAHSELTVYRASGASLRQMVMALFRIGLPLMVLSLLCGAERSYGAGVEAQGTERRDGGQAVPLRRLGEGRIQFCERQKHVAGHVPAECQYL